MFKLSTMILLLAVLVPVSPPASAVSFTVKDKCYLPGPQNNPYRCTIHWRWSNNAPNNIICAWSGISLYTCQGAVEFGYEDPYISTNGKTIEFRVHSNWPTHDPAWPNKAVVKSHGTLIYSEYVHAVTVSHPVQACDVVIQDSQSVASTVLAQPEYSVICLENGIYSEYVNVNPKKGQVLRGLYPSSLPSITNYLFGSRVIAISKDDVTLRGLNVQGDRQDTQYAISIYGAQNVSLLEVSAGYAGIGIGINLSTDIELINSEVYFAGDGAAPGAEPSIWINDSNNVRLVGVHTYNNGIGPRGDGEISCFNSPNVLIQDSSVNSSGASGMYLVNCDYIMVLNSSIYGTKEWGLDIVDTAYPSGSDFGLYSDNLVEYTRSGGGVLLNSRWNTFIRNTFKHNRLGPSASGSCDGLNVRGNGFTGLSFYPTFFFSHPSVNNNGSVCDDD